MMSTGAGKVKIVLLFAIYASGVLCDIGLSNSVEVIDSDNSNDYYRLKRAICPPYTSCVPLATCPLLSRIVDSECVSRTGLTELSCGYQGSGLICCPQSDSPPTRFSSSPGKFIDGHRCGQSQVEGDGYDGIGAYPWVARIGFRNVLTGEVKFPCTGSIINNRVILTAAHCALAKADNYKLYVVRVGEWMTNTDIDCGDEFCGLPPQDIPISHVIVHPGYEKATYKHNIALLVLRSKLNYTVTAQPICLPESWSVTNDNGILVGWGKIAGQRETPARQQHLYLPITGLSMCERVYAKTLPISDEQICAGGDSGQDACSGFGGAPLLVKHGETYYQVGILSFGSDQCGAPGVPSVYTNIKKYITWIRDNIPKSISL